MKKKNEVAEEIRNVSSAENVSEEVVIGTQSFYLFCIYRS
ncbi:unnamed protein product [Linum tenue]|uniref:Uncharacterized protein n=1 Tax=Linum tenue TaxID=586396 RepID=A0AAV0KBI8_9ROSI|nr:unnamed protein product [Linum tenue]